VAQTLPAAPVAPPPVQVAKRGLPGWLVALFVAAGMGALGAMLYLYVLPSSGRVQPETKLENAAAPGTAARAHPLVKHIEVTGIRISEDPKQRAKVQCLIVNHSGAEIADLGGTIHLRPVGKPQDPPILSIPVKALGLAPYESKEVSATVQSRVRAYELPDWQFLRADFEITSPPAS
jgi:hypothetical protein